MPKAIQNVTVHSIIHHFVSLRTRASPLHSHSINLGQIAYTLHAFHFINTKVISLLLPYTPSLWYERYRSYHYTLQYNSSLLMKKKTHLFHCMKSFFVPHPLSFSRNLKGLDINTDYWNDCSVISKSLTHQRSHHLIRSSWTLLSS